MDEEVELSYEETREQKEMLEQLLEHPAWKFITGLLEMRANARERELVRVCPNSMETMVAFAQIRGGVDELRLVPVMVQQIYSDMQTHLYKMQEEMSEDAE